MEHLLHVIFGAVKLGSEYYHKCDKENINKATILGAIGDSAVRLVELKGKHDIQSRLTTIKKQLESISGEDYEKQFETKKKTMKNKLKELGEQ